MRHKVKGYNKLLYTHREKLHELHVFSALLKQGALKQLIKFFYCELSRLWWWLHSSTFSIFQIIVFIFKCAIFDFRSFLLLSFNSSRQSFFLQKHRFMRLWGTSGQQLDSFFFLSEMVHAANFLSFMTMSTSIFWKHWSRWNWIYFSKGSNRWGGTW